MKTWTVILKILAALAAIAGVVYVIAAYGDKIVSFARRLLGRDYECFCDCDDCDCEECDCFVSDDSDDLNADVEVNEEADATPVAAEDDFEG